ncbi:MAG: Fic family protein [Acidimicrobiales bacterium]|jgi:death-on-curing protein
MSDVEYLDIEDAVALIRMLNVGPIRDVGLLDSAINRPRSSAFGEDAYPTLTLKAAALVHSVTNNHALVDGNKRIGWLCVAVFCDVNGTSVDLTDDEAFHLVWDVASSSIDVPAIAERLRLTPS